jgi:hypothetical protein
MACKIGGIGTRYERLGRCATGVHAGAAEQVALNQGYLHAGIAEPPGQGRASLTGSNYDRVEGVAHGLLAVLAAGASPGQRPSAHTCRQSPDPTHARVPIPQRAIKFLMEKRDVIPAVHGKRKLDREVT